MKKHPDRKLTLREAFQKHYDVSELSTGTVAWYRYVLNKWERTTGNPPIGKIDNETLAEFKRMCLESGTTTGTTVNRYWTALRAIFRRLGPSFTGNPLGLGIISSVPHMKRVKMPWTLPVRVPLDDLAKFYLSCRSAQYPKMTVGPPAYWWQCVLVLGFYTALRKTDLLSIRRRHIDLDKGTLFALPGKTLKTDVFPLHPVCVEHIRRIWEPEREFLFLTRGSNLWGGAFNRRWNAICEHAKVKRFRPKDIRSTAASEVEKIRPGAAAMLLQHVSRDVTHRHYLNLSDVLRDVIESMPIPLPFKHGIKLDQRFHAKQQQEAIRLRPREFAMPRKPDKSDWRFEPDTVCYRGDWFSLVGAPWRVLQVLSQADEPVDVFTLAAVVFGNHKWPREFYRVAGRVAGIISLLRDRLRRVLHLSDGWNPIPCIVRGDGGEWSLLFPPTAKGVQHA